MMYDTGNVIVNQVKFWHDPADVCDRTPRPLLHFQRTKRQAARVMTRQTAKKYVDAMTAQRYNRSCDGR